MTLLHEHFALAERCDGHNNGWVPAIDQLAEMIAESK
jgi:hypothetical protein